jgi:hypothetical protein
LSDTRTGFDTAVGRHGDLPGARVEPGWGVNGAGPSIPVDENVDPPSIVGLIHEIHRPARDTHGHLSVLLQGSRYVTPGRSIGLPWPLLRTPQSAPPSVISVAGDRAKMSSGADRRPVQAIQGREPGGNWRTAAGLEPAQLRGEGTRATETPAEYEPSCPKKYWGFSRAPANRPRSSAGWTRTNAETCMVPRLPLAFMLFGKDTIQEHVG